MKESRLPARGNDGSHLVNGALTLRDRRFDKSVVRFQGFGDRANIGIVEDVVAKGQWCTAKIIKNGGVVGIGDRVCCGRCQCHNPLLLTKEIPRRVFAAPPNSARAKAIKSSVVSISTRTAHRRAFALPGATSPFRFSSSWHSPRRHGAIGTVGS